MWTCLETFETPLPASVALSLLIRSCQNLYGAKVVELNCFAFSQGDDFKTPEGDVEDNPEDFANK